MTPRTLCDMEQTCRAMQSLTAPAWRSVYGAMPAHRVYPPELSYKTRMFERHIINGARPATRAGQDSMHTGFLSVDTRRAYDYAELGLRLQKAIYNAFLRPQTNTLNT